MEKPDPLYLPLDELKGSVQDDDFRPSWRGWIHTGVFPFVVAAGIVLIALAESTIGKAASAVYFSSSVLLFGNSALYHRIRWRPLMKRILKRIDHANIFLLIAGTYTPLAAGALEAGKGQVLLIMVWVIALFGIGFRVFWINAPRWLYVPIYLVMGWIAIFYSVDLWNANWVMMLLVGIGGLCYTMGAIFYGSKWPGKQAKHFGFHEIFHALTVAAFFCHWTAALLIGLDPIPGSLAGA